MAEAWLEEYYGCSKIITELKNVRLLAGINDRFDALQEINKVIDMMDTLSPKLQIKTPNFWRQWNDCAASTREVVDVHTLIDWIDAKAIPLMLEGIRQQGSICVEEEKWTFMSSESGYLTLKNNFSNKYLHSISDPMDEARILVEELYDYRNTEYHIWGCGLGYVVYQLYMSSNESLRFHIYDTGEEMASYAKNFGVLDWVPQDRIQYHLGEEASQLFLQNINTDMTNYYIARRAIEDTEEAWKEDLYTAYLNYQFVLQEKKNIYINFYYNVNSRARLINEHPGLSHEETIIVGAGPSLDDNLEFLRAEQGKKNIFAVGTAFRKLLAEGIIPDMVVILEADELVYAQLEGLEEEKVPMLISSIGYWELVHKYQGDCYYAMVPFDQKLMEYAEEQGLEMWHGGGTVSFFATEAAIRMGSKAIYFVGVDLAFPGGFSHATNTTNRHLVKSEDLITVKGATQPEVLTDMAFDGYRKELEQLIQEAGYISYYNVNSRGADIRGTVNV